MLHGQLIGIYLAPRKSKELLPFEKVEAVPGRGLVGDRYFLKEGGKHKPSREVTLIEAEALEALADDYQITLQPAQSRRNLLTRGVSLNHLVGKMFTIGAVTLRGILLCEPCGHLESLTEKGVKAGLIHRGGLRAQLLVGGMLEVGVAITVPVG
jgi:MOSC domain-containing protein YiiM